MVDQNYIQDLITDFTLDEEFQGYWQNKTTNYQIAKDVLDKLIQKPPQNSSEFLGSYDKLVKHNGLWSSGWLYRNKTKVATQYDDFMELLNEIKNSQNQPSIDIFAAGLKIAQKINGLGLNVLTEILMTYDPDNFPVLNNNSALSLRYLGFSPVPKPDKKTITIEVYEKVRNYTKQIINIGNFKNHAHCDVFLSYIYWNEAKD